MTPILYIKNGHLSFGNKTILKHIELYVSRGDKICLVGRNGCGKSSIMKIIAGEYEIDNGTIFRSPSITIGYLQQDIKVKCNDKIHNFVLSKANYLQSHRYNADIMLQQMHIDGNKDLASCSGGQLRQVFLIKSLILQPDILLLDEPTNHMDIKTIEWLENYIQHYPGAVICISHDRCFQENISNRVWWIDNHLLKKTNKGFKHYDEWCRAIMNSKEATLRNLNRKLEVEKNWLNHGVTARRKRNKKRLSSLYDLRQTLREQQLELHNTKAIIQTDLASDIRKTQFIIDAQNISYQLLAKKLFNNFTLQVKKGEKIGIVGPNGSGKSTLIKILMKELDPTTGIVKHGQNVHITYLDQHRIVLNPNYSLKRILCPVGGDQVFVQGRSMHVAAYLKKFMFDPRALEHSIITLSGGELNRLLLAKSLMNTGNLLILDEPTNDLDMDSLEMLLEILIGYKGTLIIVSHDRDFLERLVTRTLIVTSDKIIDLYGGYQDYLQYYKQEEKITTCKKSYKTKIHKVPSVKKLSYKYMRLLEVLPNEIDELEQKIIVLEKSLAQSDLYLKDSKKFYDLTNQLQKVKFCLNNKMEQWIEAESLKANMHKV